MKGLTLGRPSAMVKNEMKSETGRGGGQRRDELGLCLCLVSKVIESLSSSAKDKGGEPVPERRKKVMIAAADPWGARFSSQFPHATMLMA